MVIVRLEGSNVPLNRVILPHHAKYYQLINQPINQIHQPNKYHLGGQSECGIWVETRTQQLSKPVPLDKPTRHTDFAPCLISRISLSPYVWGPLILDSMVSQRFSFPDVHRAESCSLCVSKTSLCLTTAMKGSSSVFRIEQPWFVVVPGWVFLAVQ